MSLNLFCFYAKNIIEQGFMKQSNTQCCDIQVN